MRSLLRLLPLGVVAALAAVALAGCGGATIDPVAKAAEKTADAGSFRFDFSLSLGVAVAEEKQAVEVSGDGAYDASAKRVQVGVAFDGKRFEAIVDGSANPTVYVKPPAGEAGLPAGKTWAKLTLEDAAKQNGFDLGSKQLDPKQVTDMLKDAGDSTKIGTDTIDGVETTHYRVLVDTKKALEQQSAEDKAQAEKALKAVGVDRLPLDVWIDGDGLLRRLTAKLGGEGSFFTLALRLDLSDYGADVKVDLPPADAVVDGAGLVPDLGGTATPPSSTG